MIESESTPINGYRKWVYWFTKDQFQEICNKLSTDGEPVMLAHRLPGLALKADLQFIGVPPSAWSCTCKRQGCWYRHSEKNGQFLLSSRFLLPIADTQPQTVITESDFQPPRLASKKEKLDLAEDQNFRKRLPEEWSDLQNAEKRIHLKWAKRLGSDYTDFDSLFLSQTANHSNFMHPRLYIEDHDGTPIPYSIDRSAHLCSCCIELFDIIGGQHSKRLVAPCPGAVICAGLKPDRYLQVTSLANNSCLAHQYCFQGSD